VVHQAIVTKETELGELQTKIRDLGRKETELRSEKVIKIHLLNIFISHSNDSKQTSHYYRQFRFYCYKLF